MAKEKESFGKKDFLLVPLKVVNIFIASILKAVFVDFIYNIKAGATYAFKPEERKKLRRDVERQRMMEVLEERIQVLERLTWAIHNDAEYLKSHHGKTDMNDLKSNVQ